LTDDELYPELVMDHNRRPHNFRAMPGATKEVEGYNPLCGDKIRLFVKLDGERVDDVSFQGNGCAYSTASASLMTEAIKGKSREEALQLMARFHDVMTTDHASLGSLGKLEALVGLRKNPLRVKCITLAWHALKSALTSESEVVSTE